MMISLMVSICLRVHTLQANSIFQRNTNTLFVVTELDRLLQGVKSFVWSLPDVTPLPDLDQACTAWSHGQVSLPSHDG